MKNENEDELELDVEKTENFNAEEGTYPAEVKDVFELDKPFKDETDTTIRIKWRLLEPKSLFSEYVVAKPYPCSLKQHSLLWQDLHAWLGEDGLERVIRNGKLNLKALIGEKALIDVVHIDGGRKNPYVHPKHIWPPTGPVDKAPAVSKLPRKAR